MRSRSNSNCPETFCERTTSLRSRRGATATQVKNPICPRHHEPVVVIRVFPNQIHSPRSLVDSRGLSEEAYEAFTQFWDRRGTGLIDTCHHQRALVLCLYLRYNPPSPATTRSSGYFVFSPQKASLRIPGTIAGIAFYPFSSLRDLPPFSSCPPRDHHGGSCWKPKVRRPRNLTSNRLATSTDRRHRMSLLSGLPGKLMAPTISVVPPPANRV